MQHHSIAWASAPTHEELVEQLLSFDGPPDRFLARMLAVQSQLGSAEHGAVLRMGRRGDTEVLAVYPHPSSEETVPTWLARAIDSFPDVMASERSHVTSLGSSEDLYGGSVDAGHLILLPLRGESAVRGVAAFVVSHEEPGRVEDSRQRLELAAILIRLYEMRLTLRRRRKDLQRLRRSCDVVAELNNHQRYKAAAMSLCNELASVCGADRVSLGLVKGRYIKLQAMSHTEKFTRKMELVQAIESAMEECLDQDLEVVWPGSGESIVIRRSAGELASRYGPSAVLSLPLRHGGEAVGVLTVERPADRPFDSVSIETLRLACELCTVRVVELEAQDRWAGAKAASAIRQGLAVMLGPTHTWTKVAAVVVFAAAMFLVFARGTYRVEAPFVMEAVQRRVVAAPFDGYLSEVSVRPGDRVTADQAVLAELDVSRLLLERAEAEAERQGHLTDARIALRSGETAEQQIAQARAERVQARIDLLSWKIEQATIRSPIDGIVLTGDLAEELGSPLQAGQTLFEVASIEDLYADLAVPENRVADLRESQRGRLASVSNPGDYLPFEVERIDPVAEVVDQQNVFHVRVRLLGTRPWMRPGMEGIAKIDIDQRSYAWIWMHDLINWIRMKLWV